MDTPHAWKFPAAFLMVVAACGRAPAPPPPPAPAPSAPAVFVVDAYGTGVFVVNDGGGSRLRGVVKSFGGELSTDLRDLTKTRGEVSVDLASLEVHAAGDDAVDLPLTGVARAAMGTARARFVIRSVDAVSAPDVLVLAGTKRTVTLDATGDLDLHGLTETEQVKLTLLFFFEEGKITPSQVMLESAAPMTWSASAHGVSVRDAKALALLRKVAEADADSVSVTFDLRARPR